MCAVQCQCVQLNEVPYKRKRRVEVVELHVMEKDYALIHACLQLAQRSSQRSLQASTTSLMTSSSRRADEVVGLLVDVGMFDVAVNICQMFDLSMDVVFEHLTVRYPPLVVVVAVAVAVAVVVVVAAAAAAVVVVVVVVVILTALDISHLVHLFM